MEWGALRHELRKALRGRWFIAALLVAVALAVIAALECYGSLEEEHSKMMLWGHGAGIASDRSLGFTREGSFGNWIVVSANAPLSASIFFYALPLLAVIPFAWSFLSEARSGYAAQLCSRVSQGRYLTAKFASTFLTGFLVAAISLTANFIVVSCLFPAYKPLVEEAILVGVFDTDFFSWLFYNMPYAYVATYTLFDGVLMGVWAMVVLGLSVVVKDRVKLMVVPYLMLYAWHYFNGWVFEVLGVQGFNMNLLDAVRSESFNLTPFLPATLIELLVLAVFALATCRVLSKREVL